MLPLGLARVHLLGVQTPFPPPPPALGSTLLHG
jgi:hypothetical protein